MNNQYNTLDVFNDDLKLNQNIQNRNAIDLKQLQLFKTVDTEKKKKKRPQNTSRSLGKTSQKENDKSSQ